MAQIPKQSPVWQIKFYGTRGLKTTWKVDFILVLTCTIVFLIHEYILPQAVNIPAALVTLLGTALAFFVGFNNNQSYGRWWEARIIGHSTQSDFPDNRDKPFADAGRERNT